MADSDDLLFPHLFGFESLFGLRLFESAQGKGLRQGSTVLLEGAPGAGKTAMAMAICRALMAKHDDMHMFYISGENNEYDLIRKLSQFGWFDKKNPKHGQNAARESAVVAGNKHTRRIVRIGKPEDAEKQVEPHQCVGFWGEEEPLAGQRCFFANLPQRGPNRPVPSSEQLVNNAFAQIRSVYRPERAKCLVVVDSITGLTRDSSVDAEKRRLADDLIDRIRLEFEGALALVIMTNERAPGELQQNSQIQYISDYVFKLGYHDAKTGQRIRTWETVKSHGTYMVPGVHTWAIVSNLTNRDTFGSKTMQQFVASLATSPNEDPTTSTAEAPCQHRQTYATVTFFPQVSSHLNSQIVLHRKPEMIWSGTPGLDELILGDAEYWSRADLWSQSSRNARWKCGLVDGGTTLLLGASGTAKTVILTQFLIAIGKPEGALPEKRRPGNPYDPTWVAFLAEQLGKTLYINFEGWSVPQTSYRGIRLRKDKKFDQLFFRNCRQLYPAPSNMDPNRLLAELRWLVKTHKIERVAIDGLHEFAATMPAESRMDVIKSLLYVIKDARSEEFQIKSGDSPDERKKKNEKKMTTIMASYELAVEGLMAEDADSVSALADNVLMLRQVLVSDQIRKSVTVLKARTQSHDRQVREIVINPREKEQTPGCRVIGGFDGLSNVTSGGAKPASVTLQLFEANAAERRFNNHVLEFLKRRFPNDVQSRSFSRAELEQLFDESTRMLGGGSFTDIRVASLDEWWLRDLVRSLGYSPRQVASGSVSPSPILRLDGFFALKEVEDEAPSRLPHHQRRATATVRGLPSEFWITEVEKCTDTVMSYKEYIRKEKEDASEESMGERIGSEPQRKVSNEPSTERIWAEGDLDARLLAIPDYADFGLFCVSDQVKQSLASDLQAFTRIMPRIWATPTETWFGAPKRNGNTIADFLLKHMMGGRRKPSRSGFWVDLGEPQTATCFLLELSWSFGVCEEFLTWAVSDFFCENKQNPGESRQVDALRVALRLIQYLAFHGLLSIDGTKDGSVNAVLSRQWYSTLNIGRNDGKSDADQQVPVPFFPLTASAADGKRIRARHVRSEILDLRRHVSGLCKRMYWAYRWIERYWEQQLEVLSPGAGAEPVNESVSTDEKTREQLGEDLTKLRLIVNEVDTVKSELAQLRGKMDRLDITSRDFKSDVEACFAKLQQLVEQLRSCSKTPLGALSARQVRWSRWTCPPKEGSAKAGTSEAWRVLSEARRWLPAAMAMDGRDVAQILKWFDSRAKLLREELNDKDLDGLQPKWLAGFGCSGTWMLGVATETHSPRVSWKVIEELTGLEVTVERADLGAGIPTRKDFYELHGGTRVPRVPENVTWNDFFSNAGSRVRRRDVAVCRRIPLSQLTTQIHLQIMRCFRSAIVEKDAVASPTAAASVDAVARMNAVVEAAVRQIMLFIWNAQQIVSTEDRKIGTTAEQKACVSCPAFSGPGRTWSCETVCGEAVSGDLGKANGVQK